MPHYSYRTIVFEARCQLEELVNESTLASSNVADEAVGVSAPQEKHWFIAIVGHRTERVCSQMLTEKGIENYVATQWELRRWKNGRKMRVERIVLPARVFVRVTEKERLQRVVTLPYINRFVTDRARKETPTSWAPVAIIPDAEMEKFRRMLGQEELPVFLDESRVSYAAGDKVRVIHGKLAGMEGVVRKAGDGKSRLYISLDLLGSAFVEIDKNYLEPIP